MAKIDLNKLIWKIIGNTGCLRLCIISESTNFHGKESTGLITFIIEKSLSELKKTRDMIEKRRIEQITRDSPLDISNKSWYFRISPRKSPKYVLLYFFEDFNLETFNSIKDDIFFFPLLENLDVALANEIYTRIESFEDYIKSSGIEKPYLLVLFPERMRPYIPDFHIFYERFLLRLKRLPFPCLVFSKFSKSANMSLLSQLGFPYSVIFKNLGIAEISFSHL